MFKYFFCDIDRTLLASDGSLPLVNKLAIDRARDKGMAFIITSGRAAFGALDIVKRVGIRENEFVISNNGADLFDSNFNFVKHTPFPREISDIVFAYLLKKRVGLRVFCWIGFLIIE